MNNNIAAFNALHQQEQVLCLGNAWDLLSALVLEQAGFKAIGTTSWGVANTLGYKDGEKIAFDELLTVAEKIIANVTVPVTIDVEAGFASDAGAIAENVLKIADLGAAGINIEDSLKQQAGLQGLQAHCQVLEKIRLTLDSKGYQDFFINARTDTYLQLEQPLAETISRGQAYVNSGASGLFVPGLTDTDDVRAVVAAIDAPLNLMSLPNLTDVQALQQLGVKRFSIGNALSDATIAFMESQAKLLLAQQNSAGLYDHGEVKTAFK
ncbi:isocitrate lyase/phosphoenolpyruvate mutase family protein [Thalassomonas viridans]|uniref:Isocitrate lyase/phosphoenolpyruvate mutase family protein n=1 Tax=Thalassomonas viridans TaxID=137584 RepID=A0AAE9Z2M8_9GAMM|nr:isocitrate lyase/phosphoenolpyruvate mutase family protein [Thalassomonas viridans]WDE05676.1 isocitrate lyase/phosphoenolpyruvate mutase family protein [Thalassomonas viridans]